MAEKKVFFKVVRAKNEQIRWNDIYNDIKMCFPKDAEEFIKIIQFFKETKNKPVLHSRLDTKKSIAEVNKVLAEAQSPYQLQTSDTKKGVSDEKRTWSLWRKKPKYVIKNIPDHTSIKWDKLQKSFEAMAKSAVLIHIISIFKKANNTPTPYADLGIPNYLSVQDINSTLRNAGFSYRLYSPEKSEKGNDFNRNWQLGVSIEIDVTDFSKLNPQILLSKYTELCKEHPKCSQARMMRKEMLRRMRTIKQ
ncbi:MAG: hypothetical protein CR972_03000 [Candidatus Moraniibacteriota bacterium]|nr:MAG: hypothetical protein CR972_03000 [Candidatus Moranbacteria bacterium]